MLAIYADGQVIHWVPDADGGPAYFHAQVDDARLGAIESEDRLSSRRIGGQAPMIWLPT